MRRPLFWVCLCLVVLAVTCLNPWMTRFLVDHWRFHERHFRLFWLIPVPMGYAYIAVKIYNAVNKKYRLILYLAVAALTIFSSYQVYKGTKSPDIYTGDEENKGMTMVDNIYKVEDDIVEASDIIDKDSNTPDKEKIVLYNTDILLEIRVYDASIRIASYYAKVDNHSLDDALAAEDWVTAESLLYNGDAEGNAAENVNADMIRNIMNNIECEYIILPKVNPFYSSWKGAYPSIGETKNYSILKVTKG